MNLITPRPRYAGRVGVPREGERQCPLCEGAGRLKHHGPMGGCETCEGTGVVRDKRAKPEGL